MDDGEVATFIKTVTGPSTGFVTKIPAPKFLPLWEQVARTSSSTKLLAPKIMEMHWPFAATWFAVAVPFVP